MTVSIKIGRIIAQGEYALTTMHGGKNTGWASTFACMKRGIEKGLGN